ncbi:MAG: chemotaxis protein CheX [Xanthomonadaceae bacterium]|nr:chemotaxis protein CheX [Xanthomonadaceae bacterium]MCA0199200.1 chemotaxis protein CheX [Pseudomonadota bacterium]
MTVRFLGQFLLERGTITARQLQAATEAQRAGNPLLGELAVRKGLLTEGQVQRIHERQRSDDRRFGDIALALGLLDSAQLESLLAAQHAGRRLLGQVLLEQGALDEATLQAELAAHQADQAAASRALADGVSEHALSGFANGAIALCGRLFPRMLGSQCQAADLLAPSELAPYPHVAHVRIEAEHPLFVGIACDADTMHALARAFLRIEPQRCSDALALDGLGEIVSVLVGYLERNVLPDEMHYRALPPDTTTPAPELAADPKHRLAVLMNSQLGAFVLLVGD